MISFNNMVKALNETSVVSDQLWLQPPLRNPISTVSETLHEELS